MLHPNTTKKNSRLMVNVKKLNKYGTIIHSISKRKNLNEGTKTNRNQFELKIIICSFFSNFTPSNKGCTTPEKTILLGPKRFWVNPNTWRSHNVKKATLCKIMTITRSTKIICKNIEH